MPIIEPKPSSNIATPPGTSARDRAIAKLSQPTPVSNPTKVAPEEVSAITSEVVQSDTGVPAKVEAASEAPEAASEVKPEAKSETEAPLSSQFAVLARKEKALRAKMQAQDASIRAKEEAILAREQALKAKESEYGKDYIQKSQLLEDPWTALTELGFTYDDLTQRVLNQQQENPVVKARLQKMEAELQATREAQDRATKAYEDSQKQSYQQALNQIRNDTKHLVTSDPNFETIKETDSVNDVVDLIEKTFKEDGVLLSVEEAAQAVEDHLVEQLSKYAQKIKKIQQKLQPAPTPPAPAPKQDPAAPKQSQPMKTLTNSVGASRPLTAKERAILAFKGELKN